MEAGGRLHAFINNKVIINNAEDKTVKNKSVVSSGTTNI